MPPRLNRRTICALSLLLITTSGIASADDKPFGLEKRIAWTSSRLVGSPDPPLPYSVEKTLTKHTWKAPIYIAREPNTNWLWIAQAGKDSDQDSRIVRVKDDAASSEAETVIEIPKRLVYSVCFHPKFADNGFVYIFSNGPRDAPERMNQVARFTVGGESSKRIDPKSEILLIEWKSSGHDGGDMTFGADGMFYITTGDGSSDSDAFDSGQTLSDLLGSVLRIDVDHQEGSRPYSVPKDNPFVDLPGARPEIWCYGLRNPWRMCSDAKTGHIWVGNNGQDLWETAHLITKGANYGWSVTEGSHPFYLERKRGPTPIEPPTIEHSHAEFRSLTGGVVYHGERFPDLAGAYLYGDHSSGRIWGMKHDGKQVIWHRELADTTLQISAFGVDSHGEILVADYGGGIYRMVPTPKGGSSAPFPVTLSQTGLFKSTATHETDPALLSYSVNAPGWNDGAYTERFMAVPADKKVGFAPGNGWDFPNGSALVQTHYLERETGKASTRFKVETRVLLRQQGEWAGYSYRWNEDQTDASLVSKNGADAEFDIKDKQALSTRQKWRFPSRSECMACHSRAANYVLGITGSQLNKEHDYQASRDNQLRAFEHIGLFTNALPQPLESIEKLVDPRDATQDLEKRARTYLQVNCSVCHVEAGGGNAKMQLTLSTPREKMSLISARPQHDSFGMSNAMLIAPGAPERSVLLHRLSQRGRGQMPPLVSNRVDDAAVALMREWIAQLKPDRPIVQDWRIEDFPPSLDLAKERRSIESGRKAFRDTGCIECHRIEGQGGSVGPDLAGVGRRLSQRDLLESILQPSKIIADEYAIFLIETDDGTTVTGRIEREDDQTVLIRPLASGRSVSIAKKAIVQRQRSNQSNMPVGIVNVLKKEELLDLLAYLLQETQPTNPVPR